MAISSVSSGARPGVCTSTTRPTSPYEGFLIYETDTDHVLVWEGAAWVPSPNLPWGHVGDAASYATTAFSAATALTVLSMTVTIHPNRRYKIFGRIGVQVTGAAATSNALWVAETTLGVRTLAYDTRAITQFYCQLFSGSVYCLSSDLGVTSSSASKTIDMKWRCGASGGLNTDPDGIVGTNSLPHQLIIEDVGPA